MSYTEINIFKKDGSAEGYDEVRNSWRGAMAVWLRMEEKYLPEFIPEWVQNMPQFLCDEYGKQRKFYRMHQAPENGVDKGKEIWDLFYSDKVSLDDKIVLGSTFDWAIVMKEDLPRLIEAFENFDVESSLKEQAQILKNILLEDDVIAVSWNQTSIGDNHWLNFSFDEETEEDLPYNILKDVKHFNVFEELK